MFIYFFVSSLQISNLSRVNFLQICSGTTWEIIPYNFAEIEISRVSGKSDIKVSPRENGERFILTSIWSTMLIRFVRFIELSTVNILTRENFRRSNPNTIRYGSISINFIVEEDGENRYDVRFNEIKIKRKVKNRVKSIRTNVVKKTLLNYYSHYLPHSL